MVNAKDIERSSAIVSREGTMIQTLVNVGQVIDLGLNQNKRNSRSA